LGDDDDIGERADRCVRLDRRIEEGRQLVAEQRDLVARLNATGNDTTAASKLLTILRGTLDQLIALRRRVRHD